MRKKKAMSNSRDPDYKSLPVTPEEEEAWTYLSAARKEELERESKRVKSSPSKSISFPDGDAND